MQHVPVNLIDNDICYESIKNKGDALGFVPESFKTIELCKTAVENNFQATFYVPDDMKNIMHEIARNKYGNFS